MNTHARPLPVIRLAGLHLDTLGHYFAALGLLRLAAREWPNVKCCWRDGVFCLVGGPQSFSELEALLLKIGSNGLWSSYSINRPKNKPTDSQEIKGKDVSLWIAQLTNESDAILGMSHLVGGARRNFNPIFGTGGNAGKRNFIKGWQNAIESVEAKVKVSKSTKKEKNKQSTLPLLTENTEQPKVMPFEAKHDLNAFLNGNTCSLLSDYGAACWFSAANKIYNFSPDKPYRDGQLTPWAMLLACEAFPLLVGAISRQIGSQRQGTGAFPFVTQGPAPISEKEAGIVMGEFWAPVWAKPLSLPEASALFKRGRAEVNGRGAITSAAFAAAIIQKGTDAGLLEFRRFTLLHTTSAQTFESRLASIHPLASDVDAAQADVTAKIIRFRDALPREYKKGKSWIYRGLQGPIDHALVYLAETASNNDRHIDASWKLLDAVFTSLDKTAKNKTHREYEPAFALLPVSWALTLLKDTHEICREARIALALATLHSGTSHAIMTQEKSCNHTAPLLAYRVGVDPAWKNNWSKIKISKNTPLRVVWSQRELVDNLCAVIRRRVMVESESGAEPPFNARFSLSIADVLAFLNNELEDGLIDRWLTRFMLFDWSRISPTERDGVMNLLRKNVASGPLLSVDLLYAFFRPLFHSGTFAELVQKGGSDKRPLPTVNTLRPLVARLEREDSAAAHRIAVSRYKSLLLQTADFGASSFDVPEPRRLLATLLLPTHPKSIAQAFTRWVTPATDQR